MAHAALRAALALTLAALAAGACSATDGERAAERPRLRGTPLDPPLARADFTLTDTEGEPFDFVDRTQGRLTLLFFGYTFCPDVCPVHMANLGQVLERFSLEVRQRVRVVFVSTDPDRDSPERIRTWLDGMGKGFIGLRGPLDEVNRIQALFDLPPAVVPSGVTGDYTVGHAAQILVFTPDDSARWAYPFGTRQADWLHDLPALLDWGAR